MKGKDVSTIEPSTAYKYIGSKYGMWTVDSFSHTILNEKGYPKSYYYNATCECGKTKKVPLPNLVKKDAGGCGCNVVRRIDITGQQFGNWTVLEFQKKEGSKLTHWLCECSCKHKTRKLVEGNALRAGRSKGCKHCKDERKRAEKLKD